MEFTLFYIFSISLLGVCTAATHGNCPVDVEPCSSDVYTNLNEPTRSTGYNVTSINEHDYILQEAWYRSVSGAGGDMPVTPVYTGQCNAYAPIWINGFLPNRDDDDIVDLRGCASFSNDTCARTYSIPAKNCGHFNVYCLFPIDDAFDRFCIGSEVECPEGLVSDNGFTPGCKTAVATTKQYDTVTDIITSHSTHAVSTTIEDTSTDVATGAPNATQAMSGSGSKTDSMPLVTIVAGVAVFLLLTVIILMAVLCYYRRISRRINLGADEPVSTPPTPTEAGNDSPGQTENFQSSNDGYERLNSSPTTRSNGVASLSGTGMNSIPQDTLSSTENNYSNLYDLDNPPNGEAYLSSDSITTFQGTVRSLGSNDAIIDRHQLNGHYADDLL